MRKIVIIAFACWLPFGAHAVFGQTKKSRSASKKGSSGTASRQLTFAQIRKLIAIHTPDKIVAQELESRGLGEDYRRADIDQLRKQGAGPETVGVLERMIPLANLAVKTEPGADVRLDGGSPIQADGNGNAVLTGIEAGQHQVSIQKRYYKTFARGVELKGRESGAIEAKLDWAVGFLSVTPDVPDAEIKVAGNAPQKGRINRMAVPIGPASLIVNAPLRKTNSQTVNIEGGKDSLIAVSLPLDPAAASTLANQIHLDFVSRHYGAVLDQSKRFFQAGARDKDVIADDAVSYLELGNYTMFNQTAPEALSAGATLHFSLIHMELGFKPVNHPAELQLSAQNVAYKPMAHCNHDAFEVPISEIRLGKRHFLQNAFVLNLIVPNPSNPKKELTVNLANGHERHEAGTVDAIHDLLQTMIK